MTSSNSKYRKRVYETQVAWKTYRKCLSDGTWKAYLKAKVIETEAKKER